MILKIHQCPVWGNPFRLKNLSCGFSSCHFQTLVFAKTELNNEKFGSKEEVKSRFRWVRTGLNITEDQKQTISEIPPKMSNRCKAFIKQIICFTPETCTLSDLLAAWMKSMNPRRADWLSVLKEMSRLEHPLYLEVYSDIFITCRHLSCPLRYSIIWCLCLFMISSLICSNYLAFCVYLDIVLASPSLAMCFMLVVFI